LGTGPGAKQSFADGLGLTIPVLAIVEDDLALVASNHDIIHRPVQLQSNRSCHVGHHDTDKP